MKWNFLFLFLSFFFLKIVSRTIQGILLAGRVLPRGWCAPGRVGCSDRCLWNGAGSYPLTQLVGLWNISGRVGLLQM